MKGPRLIPKPSAESGPEPRKAMRAPRVGPSRVDDARARAPTILDRGPVAETVVPPVVKGE